MKTKSLILIVLLSLIHTVSSAYIQFNSTYDSLKLQNDSLKSKVASLNKMVDSLTHLTTKTDTGILFQLIQSKNVILYQKGNRTDSAVKSCSFNCKKKICKNKLFSIYIDSISIYIDSIRFVFQNDSLRDIRIYTATEVYKIDKPVSTNFSDGGVDLWATEYAIKFHPILDVIEFSKISDKKRRYHILLTPTKNEKLIF